jgi:hypothetical protein
MRVINGSQGAIVLMDEEEFTQTIPGDIRRMPQHKFTVLNGIVILDWETFETMMNYLDVWKLDDFYKNHGGDGQSITESYWWRKDRHRKAKIYAESEAKKIILNAIFIQLEERA